jgi:hypothetical protein
MPRDTAPNSSWDDDEPTDVGDDSVLDALDEYIPAEEPDDAADPWDTPEPSTRDDDTVTTVLFTATNPDGTVSVTALMGGQILRVDLSPPVTRMTESELAEEITVIAGLAQRQAQAGQHVLIALIMRQQGHDPASTQGFLERDLGLPSPSTVNTQRASIFATRYADHGSS